MIRSLKCGIGDESIKCMRGNQSRSTISELKKAMQSRHIRLVAARRDDAAFQVFIEAEEEFVLAVTRNPIFHPRIELPVLRMEAVGFPDTAISITAWIEGFVEDDDRCQKAELLLHDECVIVSKNVCQPVWVEVKVQENCFLSRIDGEIRLYVHTLFEDEEIAERLSFSINVMNVAMPLPGDFRFYLDLWQHPSNIARTHSVSLWSDEHFDVLKPYLESLAALGQKAITLIVSEVPWAGQYCFDVKSRESNLFEYSIIPVEKDEAGQLILNFSYLDRYVETCMALGIDKEIEIIGLLNIWCREGTGFEAFVAECPDAIRIRYYDRMDRKYKFCREGKEIVGYIRLLEEHMIEKGWIDLVRIMADEPENPEKFRCSLDMIKKAAPHFKYKAAVNRTAFIQEFQGEIDDYVMLAACMLKEWDIYRKMKAEGKGRYLWYACCGCKPDSCIRAPLLESRFIGWLSAYLGLEGFLRWNYTVWPENPRDMICWNAPLFPAGETCFVYPGKNGKPVLSLRYMHLRRGIRDFELIGMVREICPDHQEILSALYQLIIKVGDIVKSGLETTDYADAQKCGSFSLAYEDYETARRELLTVLTRKEPS